MLALVAPWAVDRWADERRWAGLALWLAYVVYTLGRLLWVLWIEEWHWSVKWRVKSWWWHQQDRRRMRRYESRLQRAVNADLRKRGLIR